MLKNVQLFDFNILFTKKKIHLLLTSSKSKDLLRFYFKCTFPSLIHSKTNGFITYFDNIYATTSCFWITALKLSSSFNFQHQIQPLWKFWRRPLIRNNFWCIPFVDLIRTVKAEQSSTKCSVSKGRDSRSLKQQGSFLNASKNDFSKK